LLLGAERCSAVVPDLRPPRSGVSRPVGTGRPGSRSAPPGGAPRPAPAGARSKWT